MFVIYSSLPFPPLTGSVITGFSMRFNTPNTAPVVGSHSFTSTSKDATPFSTRFSHDDVITMSSFCDHRQLLTLTLLRLFEKSTIYGIPETGTNIAMKHHGLADREVRRAAPHARVSLHFGGCENRVARVRKHDRVDALRVLAQRLDAEGNRLGGRVLGVRWREKTNLVRETHVAIPLDFWNSPDMHGAVQTAGGEEPSVGGQVAEEHGVQRGGLVGATERSGLCGPVVQRERDQVVLRAGALSAEGSFEEGYVPRSDETVVAHGEQQVVVLVVAQLADIAAMALAATQIVVTGVTHLSGCGERRDVPEENDAVFAGAHENGVVGVDRHIRDFPAVTSDGLSIPQGCGEGIQKAACG